MTIFNMIIRLAINKKLIFPSLLTGLLIFFPVKVIRFNFFFFAYLQAFKMFFEDPLEDIAIINHLCHNNIQYFSLSNFYTHNHLKNR